MKFTDEHHALYKTVKEFGEKEIKPFNEEWEKAGMNLIGKSRIN